MFHDIYEKPFSAFLLAVLLLFANNSFSMKTNDPPGFSCSDGWKITGYFTPIETDYTSKETTEVDIKGVGKMSFKSEFVKVVFDETKGFGEGWGKTRFGWYLGNYNDTWHKSANPLDSNNAALEPNSIAVDNALIPFGSSVRMPGLPGANGGRLFIANDVGVTVHGKHIDIYTGEGKEAEKEMYRVTFEDERDLQRVCFQLPTEDTH
jgi:3D (Asp-Asp-Asp) domain-containing protein